MSLLSRFARSKDSEAPVVQSLPTECSHWELAPRWDNAADMGIKDKATSYECTGCKKTFSREEAARLAAAVS
jgi:hypothetical protein